MFRTRVLTTVLTMLWLFVGLAHSFSWDIVVGGGKRLKFYNSGILTHTEYILSAHDITSVTYDPVHYRVLLLLFAERDVDHSNMSICSFDLSTRKIQPLVTREYNGLARVVYDPVTQLLFWSESTRIYSWSLIPVSSNKAVDINLVVTSIYYLYDIGVDSCGGYIYWINDFQIERAAFDGSEKEVLIDNHIYERQSLAIDQQTQKMYWIEKTRVSDHFQLSIQSADLNGKNNKTFYFIGQINTHGAESLAVSKDFIYWTSYDQRAILQLRKNHQYNVAPTINTISSTSFLQRQLTAANYTIMEQTLGMKSCEFLKSLISNSVPESSDERQLGVPGTKVSGDSRKYTQNYTGEKIDVLNCQNYCFQGNYIVNAEGQPQCSCKAGYSGERCEVNECHKHCLNNGVCSLNEEDEPVCECTAGYEGERCDVAITHSGVHADNTTRQVLRDLRIAVRQVIKEELRRFLHFFSDKINEYEAKN